MSQNDHELITAVIDGKIHRFGEVVQQHDSLVRSIIGRAIADWATREDLVQESFYRAFKNLHRLSAPCQFEGWLATITRNCLNDHFRRLARRKRREKRQIENQNPSASSDRDNNLWIWEETQQLPSHQSNVLWLKYQIGLSYAEIASRLGVPESTVRGRIYEARMALRKRLVDQGIYPK